MKEFWTTLMRAELSIGRHVNAKGLGVICLTVIALMALMFRIA
jgi:hypothetical protein